MKSLDELYALAIKATQGPWYLQDGCSWRRIGTAHGDGDVLRPTQNRSDGHPDIEASRENLEYIAAVSPDVAKALIRDNLSRRNMLDMVISSVAAALARAGVTEVDDPGEAIDVLIADKDAEIARLRESLGRIADYRGGPRSPHISLEHCRQTARAALNKE